MSIVNRYGYRTEVKQNVDDLIQMIYAAVKVTPTVDIGCIYTASEVYVIGTIKL